jgi:GTP-binding protein EngB required for normal cell division
MEIGITSSGRMPEATCYLYILPTPKAMNPKDYQEVIAPYLESWRAQYGRCIPLHVVDELRQSIDRRMKEISDEKDKMIAEAASKGGKIEIAALRKAMERSKAEYKGPDREQFIREVDYWILSLESKYGTAIPVDEASKLLDYLEADVRKRENTQGV